jgi:hypothetical protein
MCALAICRGGGFWRRAALAAVWIVTACISGTIWAQGYWGKFVGKVQSEWMGDGRKMRLLDDFAFIDPNGLEWKAPRGSVVDGASIPRFAWSFIGGPFEGPYRDASVIHDVACEEQRRTWEVVHLAFYYALLASGVDRLTANLMYLAVYYRGPRWPMTLRVEANSPRDAERSVRKQHQLDPKSSVRVSRVDGAQFELRVTPPPAELSDADVNALGSRLAQDERLQDPAELRFYALRVTEQSRAVAGGNVTPNHPHRSESWGIGSPFPFSGSAGGPD